MMYLTKTQIKEFKDNIIPKFKEERSPLMPILQESQYLFGCVPMEIQEVISKELNISTAHINGVVTFYAMFSLKPRGKHILGVCTGTACYVKGAKRLVDRVSEELDTPYGETTADGQFTLQDTRCVGTCSKAPVIMVDDDIHGNVSSDDVIKIINQYREKKHS